jgi:hypothetical protein
VERLRKRVRPPRPGGSWLPDPLSHWREHGATGWGCTGRAPQPRRARCRTARYHAPLGAPVDDRVRAPLWGGQPPAVLAARARRPTAPGLHPLRSLRSEAARHAPLSFCFSAGARRPTSVGAGRRLAGPAGDGPSFIGGDGPACFERRGGGLQRGEKLRTLACACVSSAYGKRDREHSTTLISAWGDRSTVVATSPPTWDVGATWPPTWDVGATWPPT